MRHLSYDDLPVFNSFIIAEYVEKIIPFFDVFDQRGLFISYLRLLHQPAFHVEQV